MESVDDAVWEDLEDKLSPVVSRRQLSELLGGLLSPRTLANLDSQGKGPGYKIKIGRAVGYPKDVVMSWLKQRMQFDY